MADLGLVQEVKNGKIVEDTTTKSNSKEKSNDLGYDQFLKILCAEMQYQDPLEPTSNTEYVAQLATFSQLESTLSMQNTIEGASANDLVGKYVIMKVTSSTTGAVTYPSGIVDYVLHQNGSTYLSINDKLYSLEDLDTVADTDYMDAVVLSQQFKATVSALPNKNQVTLADKDMIQQVRKAYDSLTDYQKSFIDKDTYNVFLGIEERLNELIKSAEEAEENAGSNEPETEEDTENDTTDGTDTTPA